MIPLQVIDRHQLLLLDGRRALVDTGAPFDTGRGRAASLLGERWAPPSRFVHVLDAAEKHLGVSVEWLLGYPTLARGHLLLDGAAGLARFEREPAALDPAAQRIPIVIDHDVPFLDMTLVETGQTARVVLDSGAALSYVPRGLVEGRSPGRTERDFYPGFGAFETPVWSMPVRVGERTFSMDAGVLPQALAPLLDAVSGGWILGSDFFRDRAVQLSYPLGAVIDGPSGAP